MKSIPIASRATVTVLKTRKEESSIKSGSKYNNYNYISLNTTIFILSILLSMITLSSTEFLSTTKSTITTDSTNGLKEEEFKSDLGGKDQVEIKSVIRGGDEEGRINSDTDERKDYAKELVSDQQNDHDENDDKDKKDEEADGNTHKHFRQSWMDQNENEDQNEVIFVDQNSKFTPNYRRLKIMDDYASIDHKLSLVENLLWQTVQEMDEELKELQKLIDEEDESQLTETDFGDISDEEEEENAVEQDFESVTEPQENEIDDSEMEEEETEEDDADESEMDHDDLKSATVVHRHWLTRNDTEELVKLNSKEKKVLDQSPD